MSFLYILVSTDVLVGGKQRMLVVDVEKGKARP